MVRIWHDEIIDMLDDTRLPAAHAEVHYILGALARGTGVWWKHPETQRWYRREHELRAHHDKLAELMLARGYQHKSPTPGPRLPARDAKPFWFHTPDYLETSLEQDMADLYRKWGAEGRIAIGELGLVTEVRLGAPITANPLGVDPIGKLKSGRLVYGFKEARWPRPTPSNCTAFANKAKDCAATHPHREWTKDLSKRLGALLDTEERTPTQDLTIKEHGDLLPPTWPRHKRIESLMKGNHNP
jgi:hypothetical protein